MKDALTAAARVMAMENGAGIGVAPGVAYDLTDAALGTLAQALALRLAAAEIDLISLERNGDTLLARVDEERADEPLSPMAFDGVVRKLAWNLLGEVWSGRFVPVTAPWQFAKELVRVA